MPCRAAHGARGGARKRLEDALVFVHGEAGVHLWQARGECGGEKLGSEVRWGFAVRGS